jgi:hypothetical protein
MSVVLLIGPRVMLKIRVRDGSVLTVDTLRREDEDLGKDRRLSGLSTVWRSEKGTSTKVGVDRVTATSGILVTSAANRSVTSNIQIKLRRGDSHREFSDGSKGASPEKSAGGTVGGSVGVGVGSGEARQSSGTQ